MDGCLGSREVGELVEAAVGPGARVERFDGPERFDILPLFVCTDGAVSMFGRDVRRLRPNLMIGGVEGMVERTWPGAILRLPEAEIALADLRSRCVMTTLIPRPPSRILVFSVISFAALADNSV